MKKIVTLHAVLLFHKFTIFILQLLWELVIKQSCKEL
jgi:hypothetical protein